MATKNSSDQDKGTPHPGSKRMPQWDLGELPRPPVFTWRKAMAMLGPGLFMAGAAIGGGEWLTGPVITARYGTGLLWLATLSILGQVVYNIEVSRYTLYTGEPIFAGKLRTLPGPFAWLGVYLLFDVYMLFPYLAANAAIPLMTMVNGGEVPDPTNNPDLQATIKWVSVAIFLVFMIPLVVGGKVYNSVKWLMTGKIFIVLGFLLILTLMYASPSQWSETVVGFFKFGNVPIRRGEDANGNGVLDPGEDWDGDNHLDVLEPTLKLVFDTDRDGKEDATDANEDGKPDPMVVVTRGDDKIPWPDLNQDGQPDVTVKLDSTGDGKPDTDFPLDKDQDGQLDEFINIDGDKIRDGDNLENVFITVAQGRPMPKIDLTLVSFLCALVAISGLGGLTNSSLSNYTREQGWGMGANVGAIPSLIGGRQLQLSHVGMVFETTKESLSRWRGWMRILIRDQVLVWMPGCFVGVALPAMLSLLFLDRGFFLDDQFVTAAITADGVRQHVGGSLGMIFAFLVLLCGFLVLGPSVTPSTDSLLRRWVDVFWIASRSARKMDPKMIRYVYFGVLTVYAVIGTAILLREKPQTLLFIATLLMNFAFGFSCFHTLAVNVCLLPPPLRPGWFSRIAMVLTGVFFLAVSTIATIIGLYQKGFL